MKFVKCIDNTGYEAQLDKGLNYELEGEIPSSSIPGQYNYKLRGIPGTWNKKRFIDSFIPTRVICLNAASSGGELALNKEYEVIGIVNNGKEYLLRGLPGGSWRADRFIPANHTINNPIIPIVASTVPIAKPQWLISATVNRQPGECACGIMKVACRFHK